MKEFPEFMKRHVNRIAVSSQATPGVEGYVFDRVDGSQMAFWTCSETTPSAPHVHEFDEYMVVVQGLLHADYWRQENRCKGGGGVLHSARRAARRRS